MGGRGDISVRKDPGFVIPARTMEAIGPAFGCRDPITPTSFENYDDIGDGYQLVSPRDPGGVLPWNPEFLRQIAGCFGEDFIGTLVRSVYVAKDPEKLRRFSGFLEEIGRDENLTEQQKAEFLSVTEFFGGTLLAVRAEKDKKEEKWINRFVAACLLLLTGMGASKTETYQKVAEWVSDLGSRAVSRVVDFFRGPKPPACGSGNRFGNKFTVESSEGQAFQKTTEAMTFSILAAIAVGLSAIATFSGGIIIQPSTAGLGGFTFVDPNDPRGYSGDEI